MVWSMSRGEFGSADAPAAGREDAWRIPLGARAFAVAAFLTAAASAEAQYVKTSVLSFSTTNAAWTDVPGGTLTFTPAATTDRRILLFSATLRSTSTVDQAAEVRYHVNSVEHGSGGIVNTTPNAGGAWQHFYLVTGTVAAQTVQVQIRDASASGATTTIDNLRVIAWLYPTGGDLQYAETEGFQFVTAGSWNNYRTLTFSPVGGFFCRSYQIMALATANRADVRLQDHGGGFWPDDSTAGSGPGHWVNPGLSREAFFLTRNVDFTNNTPKTFTLQANGLPGGGSVSYARILAFYTSNPGCGGVIEATDGSNDPFETSTTSTTPVVKATATATAPPAARDFIILQNVLLRGSANTYERRGAFSRAGTVTDSYGRVLDDAARNHGQFYASHSAFDAVTSATGFDLETTYSTSNASFAVWSKESHQRAIRLPTATQSPTVTTHYRSIGTNATPYTAGTVTATNGSVVVTGSGTGWQTANRGRGDRIRIDGIDFTVFFVNSQTQITLTTPFTGATGSGKAYVIARQFNALGTWEDCIDGPPGTACAFFPVASADLVADNRREVGIAYDDGTPSFVLSGNVRIQGSTTDASHTIRLTADPPNRHNGVAGAGVVVDANNGPNEFSVRDSNVTVEWLEFVRCRGDVNLSPVEVWAAGGDIATNVVLQNLLIHDFGNGNVDNSGIDLAGDNLSGSVKAVTIRNTMIWDGDSRGIEGDESLDTALIENVSIDGMLDFGIWAGDSAFTVRNTIVTVTSSGGTTADFFKNGPGSFVGSHNTSTDGTAATHFPASPLTGVTAVSIFVAPNANLHLLGGANSQVNSGTDLPTFASDIDGQIRPTGAWDRGADERDGTTEVDLVSFEATGVDSAVELRWQTASELRNLGFHLYRGDSAAGPYTRTTSSLIPGLGSSPTGQSYSYRDSGLLNGRTYFYKLEDVETTGRTELHGPVSATPSASPGGGSPPPPPPPTPAGTSYGDPSSVILREVGRGPRHVVLELLTGGFLATPAEDGRVRVTIPGFESVSRPGEPELPIRRALVEAVAGRKVRLASVLAQDVLRFPGLRPTVQGAPGIDVEENGSVLPSEEKRREGRAFRGVFPTESALLLGVKFQGETKKAEVHLFPLRWDGRRLTLSRRLLVRLDFTGTEEKETSRGGFRGRRAAKRGSHARSGVVAQLVVKERGLYRVGYEELFPTSAGRRSRGISATSLRLSRQGESVAFHVEPAGTFGPGSSLYFLSEGSSLNPYADAVYELETSGRGVQMEEERLGAGSGVAGEYFQRIEREENKYYQAGLLEAPDLWLWDIVISPGTRSYSFTVSQLSMSSSVGHLSLDLQGGSDFEGIVDHHVKVRVNGSLVGEANWDGKLSQTVVAEVPAGVLREGENTLEIEDVGDTGVSYSMVFLNRFSISYPRLLVANQGTLEGRFEASGQAEVAGGSASSVLLETTGTPRWLRGLQDAASGVRAASGVTFPVLAGRSYLLASNFLHPEVRLLEPSTLKDATNQADYLLLAPEAFLDAAQPLLELRQSQGLVTKAVSLEEVFAQFGHGETSPLAIKEFLEYAYQFWADPSPRYVLLLGDASYDPKNYLKTGVKDWLPGFPVKTSFLWTVSDPSYAAVNGEDLLPDLALGRLSAGSVEEAQRLVQKVLLFENGGGNFDGQAVLVADNADLAGNFEQDANEIASTLLAGRNPRRIYYSQEGANTRTRIKEAFDDGASLLSYVGHGGTVIWASENIFNYQDVNALALQAQQPLLLTLNCLNGFFHFPPMNSLSEAFVKAEGKGAIAAFSPSGLSVNDAANLFHKALLQEILSGRHERLGDAVLAAQNAYADSGAFPELLSIYNLFGDPALQLQ